MKYMVFSPTYWLESSPLSSRIKCSFCIYLTVFVKFFITTHKHTHTHDFECLPWKLMIKIKTVSKETLINI